MSTYLLEIGTEELPADLAESVISQLEMNVSNDLNSSKIKFSEINTYESDLEDVFIDLINK